MKSIVVDTDILIDYSNAKSEWLEEMLTKSVARQPLVLSVVTISEFLAADQFEKEIEKLKFGKVLKLFRLQDYNLEIAEIVGKLLRQKKKFSGISFPDLVIAATAIYLKAPLATRNLSHFQGIPDLELFKP